MICKIHQLRYFSKKRELKVHVGFARRNEIVVSSHRNR